MTRPPKFRCWLFFILALLPPCLFQGCSSDPKDPFALTSQDAEPNKGPSDGGYIDDGYEWSSANLGAMLNGHGLPDHYRAFVITHRSTNGQTELIWPAFSYGNEQANAEVLNHTLVFAAGLPGRRLVLMAHRVGEPPMVISSAVLRLAARRLGTSVVKPEIDYCFAKVRMPPDRIWLAGQTVVSTQTGSYETAFTLELTPDDLSSIMDETLHRGKLNRAGKFEYLAEGTVPPISISSAEAQEIGDAAKTESPQLMPVIHKITNYVPRNETLSGQVQVDFANQYAYFSTVHEPGRILKVALNGGSTNPPVVTGVTVFEGNEDKPFYSTIDSKNGYGYFGTEFPAHLVKVALGSSNAPPYRVNSLALDENWNVGQGVLDIGGGFGCFQVGNRLLKIRLGEGGAPPVLVSQTAFPSNVSVITFNSAVLDPETHCAYFGCDIAQIYKVFLGESNAPPEFVGSLALPSDEFGLRGAIIDPEKGFAWFTSQNGKLIKIALGNKNAPPKYIGALTLGSKYQYTGNTFGCDSAGYAYLESGSGGMAGDPECCAGGILKIALGKGDALPRVASFTPLSDAIQIDEGFVDPAKRMLYLGVDVAGEGCKLLKLSVGEGDTPPKIVASTALHL